MDDQVTAKQITPGRLLSQAREKLAMTPTEVARKMNLSKQTIHDLEADAYENIRAMIYIRGYLRRYADLVGLSQETVLASFDALEFDFEQDRRSAQLVSATRFIDDSSLNRKSSRRTLFWGASIILLLAVTMIVLWWLGQTHHQVAAATTAINMSVPNENPKITITPAANTPSQPVAATSAAAATTPKRSSAAKSTTATAASPQPVATSIAAPAAKKTWQPTYHLEPAT